MSGPLEGIRILDFSMVISGPLCTQWLADQGADVIKVEPPGGGDMTRSIFSQREGVAALYLNLNRNKRSICIDLRTDAGRDVLLRLADRADVLVENFRPGALERRGLGFAELKERNPRLVYVSIRGYGKDGPDAERPVYDPLIQARSGMIASQQRPNESRDLVRNSVCDKVTSIVAAQAITAALLARERSDDGGGQHVHLSMLDAAISFLWPDTFLDQTFVGPGADPWPPMSRGQRVFHARDAQLILSPTQQRDVEALVRVLGAEALLREPRFATVADRIEHIDDWNDALAAEISDLQIRELSTSLEEADVPFAVVAELDDIPKDPQVRHNELLMQQEHPTAGTIRQPRTPARFTSTVPGPARPAPTLGEHTDEVLLETGLTPSEIADLRAAGALGEGGR